MASLTFSSSSSLSPVPGTDVLARNSRTRRSTSSLVCARRFKFICPSGQSLGGGVGYLACDSEKTKLPLAKAPMDDRHLPDLHLALYDDVIVFDHVQKKTHVVHWLRLDRHSNIESAYADGLKRLEKLLSRLQDVEPRVTVPLCLSFLLTTPQKQEALP